LTIIAKRAVMAILRTHRKTLAVRTVMSRRIVSGGMFLCHRNVMRDKNIIHSQQWQINRVVDIFSPLRGLSMVYGIVWTIADTRMNPKMDFSAVGAAWL
jgi:hypothetical protein